MAFRILIAASNPEFRTALRELTDASRGLLSMGFEVEEVASLADARQRLSMQPPDAVLLDWALVPEDAVAHLSGLLSINPDVRFLLLLPDARREYREAAWRIGACACVPRERIDPEWLQAILCVMSRAKEREARIRRSVA